MANGHLSLNKAFVSEVVGFDSKCLDQTESDVEEECHPTPFDLSLILSLPQIYEVVTLKKLLRGLLL